jgi:hypothetical protein
MTWWCTTCQQENASCKLTPTAALVSPDALQCVVHTAFAQPQQQQQHSRVQTTVPAKSTCYTSRHHGGGKHRQAAATAASLLLLLLCFGLLHLKNCAGKYLAWSCRQQWRWEQQTPVGRLGVVAATCQVVQTAWCPEAACLARCPRPPSTKIRTVDTMHGRHHAVICIIRCCPADHCTPL